MLSSYRPSGVVTPLSLLGLLLVVPLAAASACVYQVAALFIPYIYIQGVLALLFAGGLGFITYWCLRWTKCRSTRAGAISGAVVGLSAAGASHVLMYGAVVLAQPPELASASVMDYVSFRTATGWSVGIGSGEGGLPITGALVWLVWLIEAGAFCVGGVLGAVAAASTPFCEACRRWADKVDTVAHVVRPTPESLAGVRAAKRFVDLLDAETGGVEEQELTYTLCCCPACGRLPTLTVALHTREVRGKERKTRTEQLHKHLSLMTEEAEMLRELAEEAREAPAAAAA